MTKNRLLNIAVVICKTLKITYILAFIATTFIFIHIQTNNSQYADKILSFNSTTNKSTSVLPFHYTSTNKWKEGTSLKDEEVYTTTKITTFSLYIIYLKYVLILILIYFCANEFQSIVQTTKRYKPFLKNNVKSFRRIGKYLIIYYVLTSYSIIHYQEGGFSTLSLSLGPLILILISFIMAEIFKEGNILMEENELTV